MSQEQSKEKKAKAGKESKKEAKAVAEETPAVKIPCRLRLHYKDKVVPAMMKKYNYTNVNKIPRLVKVVVNCCTKDAVANPKMIENMADDMAAITGQKPVVAKAKKSIATFKLRAGQPIGVTVTLRGDRMFEFLDRLINVSLPRVRDFRGVSPRGFDGKGNYTLGLREQIIFPEIDFNKIDKIRGMSISIVTTALNNEEGRELLNEFGMPFRDK